MKRVVEKGCAFFSWGSFLLLLIVLFSILGYLLYRGYDAIGISLIFGKVEPLDAVLMRLPVFEGLYPAIAGTILLVIAAVSLAVPIGMGGGIYLSEYARGGTKKVLSLLFDVLASLPSIVIGLAGFSLTIFLHHLFPGKIGPCLLISTLAITFLILPYIIRTTQTALESIPTSLRRTAPALGASRLQNIVFVLIPQRINDILGGVILAIGRAAEDTAVIMLTGVVASAGIPRSLMGQFEALPFYIYYISSQYTNTGELQMGFGAAILLLCICALLFTIAFFIQQTISWKLRR